MVSKRSPTEPIVITGLTVLKIAAAPVLPILIFLGFHAISAVVGFVLTLAAAIGAGVAHRPASAEDPTAHHAITTVGILVAIGVGVILETLAFAGLRRRWKGSWSRWLWRLVTLAYTLVPLWLLIEFLRSQRLLYDLLTG